MAQAGSYLVRLNSSDRISGTLNNFIVDCSCNQQLQSVKAVRVHTISFPNVQTNVTDANNVWWIEPLGFGLNPVVIPPGQYVADDLPAVLTALVNTAFPGVGFACTLDNEFFNPRFSFTSTTAIQYYSEYDLQGVSGFSRVLGLSVGSNAPVLAFSATSIPSLRGLTVASLQSQTIAMSRAVQCRDNQNNQQSTALSTVTEIPIDVEWLGQQSYRPILNQTLQFTTPVTITNLEFTLRDPTQGGRLVDLNEPGLHILLEVQSV